MELLKTLFVAITFLTKIPMPLIPYQEKRLRESVIFFPVVGALIGSLYVLIYTAAQGLLTTMIAGVFVLFFGAVITGFLHYDGLMDTFDGIGSQKPKDAILEIMKDSRVGAIGVIMTIFITLLQWSAIVSIPEIYILAILFVAPIISRSMMVYAMFLFPSAKHGEGLGGIFAKKVNIRQLSIVFIITIGLSVIALQMYGVLLFILVLGFSIFTMKYISMQVGGMTGDTYGAIQVIAELYVYLFAVFVFKGGWL
ncbi:cobalamin 5'-phosphate synthase [Desulfuribacillus stibiiarsenatis]|uniref:Adenosylcobinamide-GDP ribazoletransferase n=1 Tax=Desulfuribacillus stibiiarsenatis TaxID=1390249 RepID=A0A1E5L3T4_9FIRM|nr:adenosylcobinamide-GDP ribazoletransferase [Desulfuribacillus stibiiarsenatis]OEH84765.1 cobalamin 5'-phosphate synthase [Desulfuribacillus stibiiarsenatis]